MRIIQVKLKIFNKLKSDKCHKQGIGGGKEIESLDKYLRPNKHCSNKILVLDQTNRATDYYCVVMAVKPT